MAAARRNWLKALKNKTPRNTGRRPSLELLEDRVTPSGNPTLSELLQHVTLQANPSPNLPGHQVSGTGVSFAPITVTGPKLHATADQSGSSAGNGYTPAQIRAAYGFDQLPGTAAFANDTYDTLGSGQTIAIVDAYDDPYIAFDLQQFDENFGINGTANDPTDTRFFTEVNEYGGSALPSIPTSTTETALDVEWAHAIAPGANILLVEADSFGISDLNTAIETAAKSPGVSVVSMSFGTSEYLSEYLEDGIFTTPLGHQGVSFIASAGDSAGAVQYPAASPNVLSVGGTSLGADLSGNPDLTQETGWSNSGGGMSAVTGIFGTPVGEGQPAYQSGVVPSAFSTIDGTTYYRTTPDVAFDADPNTGFPVYDSFINGAATPWSEEGGTSAATAQWSALVAIVNEGRVTESESTLDGPSQLLPALYQIPNFDPAAFNDITTGAAGSNSAGTGYDLVTGLGTPNAQNLVPDLVFAFGTPSSPQTIYWTNDTGDQNWNDPGNWSFSDPLVNNVPESVLPGPTNDVVIDEPGTITMGEGATNGYAGPWYYNTINSLTVTTTQGVFLLIQDSTLDLSGGGKLGLLNIDQSTNTPILVGGVIKDAEVTSNTAIYVFGYDYTDTQSNELYGVQLDGTLDLSEYDSDYFSYDYVQVQNGLTLDGGTILLGSNTSGNDNYYSFLFMGASSYDVGSLDNNPETLSGTGSVLFGVGDSDGDYLFNDGYLYSDGNGDSQATVTIGPGITIVGGSDSSVEDYYYSPTSFDNQGTIEEFNSGSFLTIDSYDGTWTNDGTINVGNNVSATLDGTGWVNNGTISFDSGTDATLSGYGSFWSNSSTGQISVTNGSTLNVNDFLTNDGDIVVDTGSTANLPNSGWSNGATAQISATNGSTLDLPSPFTNLGTVSVDASTVTVSQPTYGVAPDYPYNSPDMYWSNQGTFSITDGSTANLGGVFTTDTFESIAAASPSMASDTLNLEGSLDNSFVDNPVSHGVLQLNALTGPLNLFGAYIDQGTILTSGSNDLVVSSFDEYVDLNAVTLDGTLDMSQGYLVFANITNGLTLNGTINLGGTYTDGNGNAFLYFGNYDDNVPQTLAGTGVIQFGDDPYGDSIYNFSNKPLTFGPGITIEGGYSSNIYASNSGTESSIVNLGTIEDNAAFDDGTGTGTTLYGVLQVNGLIGNYDASTSTLSGGTWEAGNGASLELIGVNSGVNIVNNAANISVSGTGSEIYSDYGLTDALAGFTTNETGASFTVGNGYSFTAPGDFSNAGAVTVAVGGSFSTGGSDYTQSAGTTTVDGTLDATNVGVNGGSLNGSGTVQAEVTNAATVHPGDPTGILTITGDYTQTSTGVLDIALADHSSSGNFGQLAISGNASVDGTLTVTESGAFVPSPGDAYSIATFASETGDFATENGLTVSNSLFFTPQYDPTSSPTDLTLATVGVPTLIVTAPTGVITYDGNAHAASDTVNGGASLEGVSPTLSYYLGTYSRPSDLIGLTPLSGAPVAAGSYTVLASFPGSADYTAAPSEVANFTISPRTLIFTLSAQGKPYDSTTSVSNITFVPDNLVSGDQLTYNYSAAYVDPNVGMAKAINVTGISLSGLSAGDYTVSSTANASADITPAATSTVIASPATITYGAHGLVTVTVSPITPGIGNPTGNVSLSVDNGTPLSMPLTNGAATFDLGVIGAAHHTLSATYAAQGNFATSASITGAGAPTLQVNQATPVLTWNTPPAITFGTALSSTQLDATTPVAGTFSYTPAAGLPLLPVGNGQALLATFTPTDATDYTQATKTVFINVSPASTSVTFSSPLTITFSSSEQVLVTVTAGPGAGTPTGNVTLTVDGSTHLTQSLAGGVATFNVGNLPVSVSGHSLSASYAAQGNFAGGGSTSGTLQVTQATPTITWTSPAAITFGTALSGTQLDATASVAGTFSYTPAAGTVLNAGSNQTLSVTFTPTDSTDFTTATGTASISVNPAATGTTISSAPTVTFGAPGLVTVTVGSGAGTPTGTVALIVDSNTTFSAPLSGGTATFSIGVLGAGDHSLVASYTAQGNFAGSGSTPGSLHVNQAAPTLTWTNPADIIFGTALSATQLDASASVAGTFTYNPPLNTVLPTGSNQTLSVTFTPTDTTDYTTASTMASINVDGTSTSIAITSAPSVPFGAHGLVTVTVTSTGSGATPTGNVTLSVDNLAPVSKTLSGNGTASFDVGALGAGDHTLSASYAAQGTFAASGPAPGSLHVNQSIPILSWSNPPDITFGTALGASQLDATTTTSVAGSFIYSPAAGTVLNVGSNQPLTVTFMPTDAADFATVTKSVSINVSAASTSTAISAPAITFGSDGLVTVTVSSTSPGTPTGNVSLSVDSGTAVSLPLANGAATFDLGTSLGAGDHTLSASYVGQGNFTASGPVPGTLHVNQATPTITWTSPAAITFGAALGNTQLDASASVAGTFSYTPAAGTVLNAGSNQTLSATFTPTDTTDYTTATKTVSINVSAATTSTTISSSPTITFGAPGLVTVTVGSTSPGAGTPTGTVSLTVDSGTTFSSPLSGGTATFTLGALGASSHSLVASYAAQGNFALSQSSPGSLQVNKATPVLTWSNPADITYGTALGSAQLDATSPVSGSISYNPAVGTVLNAGTSQSLTATFTPTDAADYTTATKTVSINVSAAPTATSIAAPAITVGLNGVVTVTVGLGQGAPAGAGTPTGNASLTVDTSTPLSQPLINGQAIFDVPGLGSANHTLSASYAAQGNFAASSSVAGTLPVNNTVSVSTANLSSTATANQKYDGFLQSSGGTGQITYSATSALPDNLSLNPTTGEITGTPTTFGDFKITFNATDSLGQAGTPVPFTLQVNPASWTLGKTGYSQSISETGFDTFKLATGSVLPKGLTLNAITGVISGTPTQSKTTPFSFTIAATDTGTGVTTNQTFLITINPALSITTKALPSWTIGAPNYSATVTTLGGTLGETFKVSSGKLPVGLSLNPVTGVITGTPTTAGKFTFTVAATDGVLTTATKTYTVVINPALTFTTKTLPAGSATLKRKYSQTIKVKGGTVAYTFSVLSGTLPPGLKLNTATGAITGTPTTANATPYSFVITVTDKGGASIQETVSILIS